MTTRYSATTGSFYPFDIDYGANLPADVIEVQREDYDAAMSRPAGTTFAFTKKGKLSIVTLPPPVINPNDAINAQIASIETSTMVPRAVREFMMRTEEDYAARNATPANTDEVILLANAGYQRTKAVDDKVRALRAQLK